MVIRVQSPEQVKIVEISLESEKFARPFILAGINTTNPIVSELNIYENITRPFLTGNIVIQDDTDLLRRIKFDGTERIKVIVSYPSDEESDNITKTFIAANILNLTKINDYTTMASINLIEDIGFFDKIQKISKHYDGTGEQIIRKIVIDNLQRDPDTDPVDTRSLTPSHQSAFRYIIPYQTPFEAIRTILYKMTTSAGLPYFFYSTLNSDQLILTDMESIYRREPFNVNTPFVFSQMFTNNVPNIELQAFTLYSFDGDNLDNTLLLAQKGGTGIQFSNTNMTTGSNYSTHVDMYDEFQGLTQGILPEDYQQDFLFNRTFIADPSGENQAKLTEYSSVVRSSFSVSDTFPYDNLNGFNEETNQSDHRLKVVRDGFIEHIMKTRYKIFVPGLLFLTKRTDTSVGSQINIRVFRSEIEEGPQQARLSEDEKKSGNYIILTKRHVFDIPGELHNVSMEISRLSNKRTVE
jgi:hypothetical protein